MILLISGVVKGNRRSTRSVTLSCSFGKVHSDADLPCQDCRINRALALASIALATCDAAVREDGIYNRDSTRLEFCRHPEAHRYSVKA